MSTSGRKLIVGGLLIAAVLLGGLAPLFLAPIDPRPVKLDPISRLPTPSRAEFEAIDIGAPYIEAVASGRDGSVALADADGRVFEIAPLVNSARGEVAERRTVARLDGHAIGLVFDEARDTYWSATFPVGLQSIDGSSNAKTVVGDSHQLYFPDDVVVGDDGLIYVIDTSRKYNPVTTGGSSPYLLWDFIEGRANGRLLAYDPEREAASVVKAGLAFPTGLAKGGAPGTLLVVESSRYRIIQVYVAGPRKGQTEIVASGLPGIPDDVFLDHHNRVWVSLVGPRSPFLDTVLLRYPYASRLVSLLPWDWQNEMLALHDGAGGLLRIDSAGRPDCYIPISKGAPPANALLFMDQFIVGRLGGNGIITISQSGLCQISP